MVVIPRRHHTYRRVRLRLRLRLRVSVRLRVRVRVRVYLRGGVCSTCSRR